MSYNSLKHEGGSTTNLLVKLSKFKYLNYIFRNIILSRKYICNFGMSRIWVCILEKAKVDESSQSASCSFLVLSRPSRVECALFLVSLVHIFHLIPSPTSLSLPFLLFSVGLTTLFAFSFSSIYSLLSSNLVYNLQIYHYRLYSGTNFGYGFLSQVMESIKPFEPERSSYKQAFIWDLGHNVSSFGKDQEADTNISFVIGIQPGFFYHGWWGWYFWPLDYD